VRERKREREREREKEFKLRKAHLSVEVVEESETDENNEEFSVRKDLQNRTRVIKI